MVETKTFSFIFFLSIFSFNSIIFSYSYPSNTKAFFKFAQTRNLENASDFLIKTLNIKDSSGKVKIKISLYGAENDYNNFVDAKYSLDSGDETTLPLTDITKGDDTKKLKINLSTKSSKSYKFYSCCPSEEDLLEYIISSESSLTFENCREISNFNFDSITESSVNSNTNTIGANALTYNMSLLTDSGVKSVQYSLENSEKSSMVEMIRADDNTNKISTRFAFKANSDITTLNQDVLFKTDLSVGDINDPSIEEGLKLTNCADDVKDLDASVYKVETGTQCKEIIEEGIEEEIKHTSIGQSCTEAKIYSYTITRGKKEKEEPEEVKPEEEKDDGGLPGWAIAVISTGSVLVAGAGAFSFVWFKVLKKSCPCKKGGNGGGEAADVQAQDGDMVEGEGLDEVNQKKKRSIKNEVV